MLLQAACPVPLRKHIPSSLGLQTILHLSCSQEYAFFTTPADPQPQQYGRPLPSTSALARLFLAAIELSKLRDA